MRVLSNTLINVLIPGSPERLDPQNSTCTFIKFNCLKPLRVHFLPFLVPGDSWLRVSSCLAYKRCHPSRHTNLVHRLFNEHRGTFSYATHQQHGEKAHEGEQRRHPRAGKDPHPLCWPSAPAHSSAHSTHSARPAASAPGGAAARCHAGRRRGAQGRGRAPPARSPPPSARRLRWGRGAGTLRRELPPAAGHSHR